MAQTYVVSLGGSLIVPKEIDTRFLKKFKVFVEKQVNKGNKFVIVCGGGATAREYRDAGSAVIKKMPIDDLDWLGIHATRLNGHLIRTIFRNLAHPVIINNPDKKLQVKEKLIIAAGHKPGSSSDLCAVKLARSADAKVVLNLSNVDYVYDKNPKLPGAKKIEKISWTDFRKIVGNKWDPGLHAPFDPIASQYAQKENLTVIVLQGKDLNNLEKLIAGKKFKGTTIQN